MNQISNKEIRALLIAVETIAVRPAQATQKELMIAPALFKKLMEDRTQGVISIQVLIDGKYINIEAVA
ncbi:hypothetical protein [Acinetobacter sp. YH12029]|uniref:hypothetical protein n=1 Tax=Acinetobacter sp. YH12029 TaxID=2601044 RepID=UPI0015D1F11A|nr:hypothetical protein [Acinetobacter sp. YH12029]